MQAAFVVPSVFEAVRLRDRAGIAPATWTSRTDVWNPSAASGSSSNGKRGRDDPPSQPAARLTCERAKELRLKPEQLEIIMNNAGFGSTYAVSFTGRILFCLAADLNNHGPLFGRYDEADTDIWRDLNEKIPGEFKSVVEVIPLLQKGETEMAMSVVTFGYVTDGALPVVEQGAHASILALCPGSAGILIPHAKPGANRKAVYDFYETLRGDGEYPYWTPAFETALSVVSPFSVTFLLFQIG
eukprot:tig00001220_g7619.t1